MKIWSFSVICRCYKCIKNNNLVIDEKMLELEKLSFLPYLLYFGHPISSIKGITVSFIFLFFVFFLMFFCFLFVYMYLMNRLTIVPYMVVVLFYLFQKSFPKITVLSSGILILKHR